MFADGSSTGNISRAASGNQGTYCYVAVAHRSRHCTHDVVQWCLAQRDVGVANMGATSPLVGLLGLMVGALLVNSGDAAGNAEVFDIGTSLKPFEYTVVSS